VPTGGWSAQRDRAPVIRLLTSGGPSLIRDRERIVRVMLRIRARWLALLVAMERGDRLSVRDVDEFLRDIEGCAAFYDFIAWIKTQQPLEPSRPLVRVGADGFERGSRISVLDML
jgi:hypothetical protein